MKFDNTFSLSSGPNKDPLIVVTVSLGVGNKHRGTIIAGLTCLWDSVNNGSTIKKQHNKPYHHKLHPNTLDYSTASGSYYTTHDVKMPSFMPDFYSIKIILHRFHVDSNEEESGIGCDIIIVCELVVQLGLSENFKHQVFQWDGATALKKEPSGLLGKTYLTSRKIGEVLIQTAEPFSNREATEMMIIILESTYGKE